MVKHFVTNIIKYDAINKLNYRYSSDVFKSINFKLMFYSKSLLDMLFSIIFIKILGNSCIRLCLNLNKDLFICSISNDIKNSAIHNLFLVLVFTSLPFVNKFFNFFYSYYHNLTVLHLKTLQKSYIISNRFKVILTNVRKDELNFIVSNNQLNLDEWLNSVRR